MAITERYVTSTGTDTYANSTNPATPCSLTTAIANMTAGDRFNVKAGTYTRTGSDNFANSGTSTSPIIFRGYSSTITDGYLGRTNDNGPIITTNFPNIAYDATFQAGVNGNLIQFECINFSGNRSGHILQFNAATSSVIRCKLSNASTNGSASGMYVFGGKFIIFDCDFSLAASGGSQCIYFDTVNGIVFHGCRVTSPGCKGIYMEASTGQISGCTIYACGSHGIEIGSSTNSVDVIFNTIQGNTGDGVRGFTSSTKNYIIANNCITDNGGYGINPVNASCAMVIGYNRTRDNTSGAINTGSAGDWVNGSTWNEVTTDTGGASTDYTNAGTGDFSLISTSPAAYVGLPLFASMGALQRPSGGGSAGMLYVPNLAGT